MHLFFISSNFYLTLILTSVTVLAVVIIAYLIGEDAKHD